MKLHEDNERFRYLVGETARYIGFSSDIICKDYYVMLLLKEIIKVEPDLIFKGGTSLSKAWHVINRFSEDIDLTHTDKLGESRRHRINKHICEVIRNLELVDTCKRKYDKNPFRRFIVDYPKLSEEESFYKKDVIIESAFQLQSFPTDKKYVCSYITDYLKSIDREDLIEMYELEPFEVNVQTLDRTFIDKVFALCDYKIEGRLKMHARHIYDLYKLYPLMKFDDNFKNLVKEIRELRKDNEKCFSAKDGEDVNSHLKEIIENDIYKSDYNDNTTRFFHPSENTKYEEALSVITKIIESNMFEAE